MRIGIAYDLKSDHERASPATNAPDDRFEELDSRETVDAIAAALSARGHEPALLGGGRAFIERVLARPPELVFNIAEGVGTRSREAHVPSVCEMLGIPVTHSDPLTLAVTLDKAMAKRLVAAAGVATPRFAIVESREQAEDVALEFPLIAKPLFEGSSIGIRKSSRVTDFAALLREVERLLADYREPVLVEEFCCGAELTIGVLGNGIGARAIAAMEIAPKIMKRDEFVYSLEVKRNWREEVEYRVPPRVPATQVRESIDLALDAYRALGCRDVARVDVRMTARGEPRFLEINPLPGLNPTTGDIVILAERSGIAYEELIARIVEHARSRYGI
jgi:D-alanine-D-alanine ligase